MPERDPVSVLLPTVEWGSACEQLAASLGPADELLVLCDAETDPVAAHDPPDGVEILVAGEPTGCSGKANALAHGMEHARHDRFVWTDDDFERSPEWLDTLVAAGERHGPASAIPLFTGAGWWRLVEPWYGALFTLLFYFQIGGVADTAWGGGVTFTREELVVDVPTFAAELRGVLSDDYLLTQRLPSVHAVRSLLTHVEVPGDLDSVLNRVVRFTRIVGVNEGWHGLAVYSGMTLVALSYPLVVAPLSTLVFAGVYALVGLRRPTFLLAYPCLLVLAVATLASRVTTDFDWAGRRYRFADDGSVRVLDSPSRRADDG